MLQAELDSVVGPKAAVWVFKLTDYEPRRQVQTHVRLQSKQ